MSKKSFEKTKWYNREALEVASMKLEKISLSQSGYLSDSEAIQAVLKYGQGKEEGAAEETPKPVYEVILGKKVYGKPKETGASIINKAFHFEADLKQKQSEKQSGDMGRKIGEMYGMEILLKPGLKKNYFADTEIRVELLLKVVKTQNEYMVYTSIPNTPLAVGLALMDALHKITIRPSVNQKEIDALEKKKTEFLKLVGEEWKGKAELDSIKARLAEIDRELDRELDKKEEKPQEEIQEGMGM